MSKICNSKSPIYCLTLNQDRVSDLPDMAFSSSEQCGMSGKASSGQHHMADTRKPQTPREPAIGTISINF